MVLGTRYDFCQEISNHLFSDAIVHCNVAKTNIAPNKVVPNLQMSYIAKTSRVGCDMKTRHAIRVHTVWLGTGESKKTHHVLGVDELFAGDTCRNEFSGTRGVNHNGLFQRAP